MDPISKILLRIISGIFLMAYYWCFIKRRYEKPATIAILAGAAAGLTLLDYVMIFLFPMYQVGMFAGSALEAVLVQGTAQLMAKKRGSMTLFIGLSASNYVMLGNTAMLCVKLGTGSLAAAILVQVLVDFTVLHLMKRGLRKIYSSTVWNKVKIWLRLCLIPVFYYCAFFLLAVYPVNIYERTENLPGVSALLVTMVATYLILINYIFICMRRVTEADRRLFMVAFSRRLAEDLENLRAKEQSIRVLNHDRRHISIVLKQLMEQKNYDEVKRILDERLEQKETDVCAVYCENLFVNSILDYMSNKKKEDVTLHIKASIPKELPVDSMEFAMVISNLLENAIDAAQSQERQEKAVYFLAKCDNGRLIVEIQNPFEGTIEFDSDSGLPLSHRGRDHGFGMISIDTFVKKYGAEFDCYEKDGRFVARLLIGGGKAWYAV